MHFYAVNNAGHSIYSTGRTYHLHCSNKKTATLDSAMLFGGSAARQCQ